ncbi:MAG: ATP-dependent DNA helicase RecG [Dehalococcoidia bacterium]|nr:ATP-dependent DNA helicase RecG [Dehalococcoidia bacterium]
MADVDILESLHKILVLETQKGFKDTAVIGGLDAFLSGHLDQQQSWNDARIRRAIQELWRREGSYKALDAAQREHRVQTLLSMVVTGVESAVSGSANSPATDGHLSPDETTSQPTTPPTPSRTGTELRGRPVTVLRGISTRTAESLSKLGVATLTDFLYLLPRRYLDYTQARRVGQLEIDREQTAVGSVARIRLTMFGGRRGTEAYLIDDTGSIRLVWFNQPWVAKNLASHPSIVVSGRVSYFRNQKQMESPEWEPLEKAGIHTGRLVPVYPLTRGLSSRQMRRWMTEALQLGSAELTEYLPEDILSRNHLMPLSESVHEAHFPTDMERATRARQRLTFDELLALQLGLLMTRQRWQRSQPGIPLSPDDSMLREYLANLPYHLTSPQQRALKEIMADIAQPVAMSRLLQGDVGSGKTVVALAALLMAVASGLQGALMAPTEVLAEQHYRTFESLLKHEDSPVDEPLDGGTPTRDNPILQVNISGQRIVTLALLTGSLSATNRRRVHAGLSTGEIDIVVGTQALVQSTTEFKQLGLAVVDEQHRFGVMQRGGLRQKGFNPHVLAMTATPIPRSLALTVYGDLDLSVIDSLPPGRQEIVTSVISSRQMDRLYRFLRSQVQEGRQAYIICPLINESEKLESAAAKEQFDYLHQSVFPDLRLGLLHGALHPRDKDKVMRSFRDGAIDILVSTTVIEVGVDVPNATVMVILGAERFGLSQLHQLRGRVGRGAHKSNCVVVSDSESPDARKRLRILESTNNGFELADYDMKMRGPGDFLGTNQSGLPQLQVATLTDLSMLETARKEAQHLISDERFDTEPRYVAVRERVNRLWSSNVEWS